MQRTVAISLVLLFIGVADATGGTERTFSLDNSTLLFSGFEPTLIRVTPVSSTTIQPPPNAAKGPLGSASLSQTGTMLAWSFRIHEGEEVKSTVGVFSSISQRWNTYGNYRQVYANAISANGASVAFIANTVEDAGRRVFLLDTSTGKITELSRLLAATLSLSPDGKIVSLGTPGGDTPPEVYTLDARSGSLHKVAKGQFPSWSPSGEWLAYIDENNTKVHVVRPDGKDDRVVLRAGHRVIGYRFFGLRPVWSPDSSKLLINEYKDDGDSEDIVLLDLRTGHTLVKSQNGFAIVGWAAAVSH